MHYRTTGKSAYGEEAEIRVYYGEKSGLTVTRDILTKNAHGQYAITHYPTGYRLAWFKELWQAAATLELLKDLGPWDTATYEQSAIDAILNRATAAFKGL